MKTLYKNFHCYRLKKTYLQFKNTWLNEYNYGKHLNFSEYKYAYHFKEYILTNNLIKKEKDLQLFKNLTFDRYDGYYAEKKEKLNELKYYANLIKLETIVSYVLS